MNKIKLIGIAFGIFILLVGSIFGISFYNKQNIEIQDMKNKIINIENLNSLNQPETTESISEKVTLTQKEIDKNILNPLTSVNPRFSVTNLTGSEMCYFDHLGNQGCLNESYIKGNIAVSPWLYNQSLATSNMWNISWSSTYNSTYNTWAYNQTNGAGSTVYVPYTGASNNVNLGTYNINASYNSSFGDIAGGNYFSINKLSLLGYNVPMIKATSALNAGAIYNGIYIIGDPAVTGVNGQLGIYDIASSTLATLSYSGTQFDMNQPLSVTGDITGADITALASYYFEGDGSHLTGLPNHTAITFNLYNSTWDNRGLLNSSYVPYTGAIKNVNLGAHNLTANGYGIFGDNYVGIIGNDAGGIAGSFEAYLNSTGVYLASGSYAINAYGNSLFNGNVNMSKSLIVEKDTNITQNLIVGGNITGNIYYGEMKNWSDGGWVATPATTAIYENITGLYAGLNNDFTFNTRAKANGGDYLQVQHNGTYAINGKITTQITTGGIYGFGIVKNGANPEVTGDCYGRQEGDGKWHTTQVTCFMKLNKYDNLTMVYDDEANPVKAINIEKIEVNVIWIGY